MNRVLGPAYNGVVKGCEQHEDFGIFASSIVKSTLPLGFPRGSFLAIMSGKLTVKLQQDIRNDRASQNCYWVLFSVTRFKSRGHSTYNGFFIWF